MNIDEAFEYLNMKGWEFLPEGHNFKIRFKYVKSEKDKFHEAFQLAYGEHGQDVYINDVHYKVITSEYGLYYFNKGDVLGKCINHHFGPFFAEALLSREHNFIVNTSNVNISNAEQIVINTKMITSIKSKKMEIINNHLNVEKNDFVKLLKSIENIENNLINQTKQNEEDTNTLNDMARKYPELRSFIADIITIISPIISVFSKGQLDFP